MASIRKRDGKYQARVVRQGHKPIAKSFISKTEAIRWARQTEVAMERGAFGSHTGTDTLRDLLLRYKTEVTPTKKNARSEGYLLDAWSNAELASRLVKLVHPEDIAKWRDKRLAAGAATGTIRNALAALSAVYRHASMEWGHNYLDNPVMKLKRPAPCRARSRRVSQNELTAIKAATESQELPTIIDLAIETGMRLSEIVGLVWRNIDMHIGTAHLPDTKNGDTRTVPLSSKAVSVLTQWRSLQVVLRLDGRVFSISPHAVSVAFRRAVKRADGVSVNDIEANQSGNYGFLKGIRFHDLRHEAITRMFELGLNPIEVSAVSGHRTMQMLKRYSHLKPEELAKKLG